MQRFPSHCDPDTSENLQRFTGGIYSAQSNSYLPVLKQSCKDMIILQKGEVSLKSGKKWGEIPIRPPKTQFHFDPILQGVPENC